MKLFHLLMSRRSEKKRLIRLGIEQDRERQKSMIERDRERQKDMMDRADRHGLIGKTTEEAILDLADRVQALEDVIQP